MYLLFNFLKHNPLISVPSSAITFVPSKDKPLLIGDIFTLTCITDSSNPPTYVELHGPIGFNKSNFVLVKGDFHGQKFSMSLSGLVAKHHNGMTATCIGIFNNASLNELNKTLTLNVACRYLS